jgi:hypothetical protein
MSTPQVFAAKSHQDIIEASRRAAVAHPAVTIQFQDGIAAMTVDDFRNSLDATDPPPQMSLPLAGLWWDAKGDWTRAHECAQQVEDSAAAWVHAYLHRKEGDQSNAAYWYRRAGKPVCREPLGTEWLAIVNQLLK